MAQREYTAALEEKNKQLQEAVVQARKANAAKNNFLSRMYPNNIFAVYTLVFLYKIAITVHSQDPYFVIVAMNNLVVNISVLLAVLSIYKITKKQSVTMVSMLFGVILIGLSPWIVIPYTDTLGMLFPIGAVFCYVYFRNRYLRYFLFVVLCGIGYLYKPTVAIGLIALVIVKMFSVLRRVLRHRLKP